MWGDIHSIFVPLAAVVVLVGLGFSYGQVVYKVHSTCRDIERLEKLFEIRLDRLNKKIDELYARGAPYGPRPV